MVSLAGGELPTRVGGQITLGGDPHQESLTGTVIAYTEEQEFGFDWGSDQLYLSVEPDPDGGARFRLVNILRNAEGAARNAAGWDVCLDQFELALTGTSADAQNDGTLEEFTPVLAAYVAKGFPPDDGWLPEDD